MAPADIVRGSPPRFKVRRLPDVEALAGGALTRFAGCPWVIRDAERPAFLGRSAQQQDAIRAIDSILVGESRSQGSSATALEE